MKRVQGPYTIRSASRRKAYYVSHMKDTHWIYVIHGTHERDLEKIEELFS